VYGFLFQGYDLITGKIFQGLPIIGIKYLTQLFNAVLLTGYFPAQWKVAHILTYKPVNTVNTKSSVPLQTEELHNIADTSSRKKDK
jgi:hypothetical protein